MGGHKLHLPWRGRTVLDAVLEAWKKSRVGRIVVVVRAADADTQSICRRQQVDYVTPDVDPEDMRASLLAGLAYAERVWRPEADWIWLVAPADMPLLSAQAINAVCEGCLPNADRDRVVIPVYAGRRGHPVALPWRLADELRELPAGSGLRDLIARHPQREIPLADPQVALDLDTPEDWRRLREFE
jgi:molybdenum cofactor cytidylyltransferase